MNKIVHLITSFILLVCVAACVGYEPIYSSAKLQFKIADYSIKADKRLGNQIYSQLYKLSKSSKNNENTQSIHVTIQVLKDKNATIKDSAGKILEYRVSLNTNILIKDFLSDSVILNQNFNYASTYKVQDQHSETTQLENKTIDNILNKTFENLLTRMSENMSAK